jgi:predicted RNA-binding Zn-ribbon protein involved in translation (DUF1610 family)
MKANESVRAKCKTIAEEIESFCGNNKYRCPICGKILEWDDANYYPEESVYTCDACMSTFDEAQLEAIGIEDFFFTRECTNTIYRIDSNGNYHSVKTELVRFDEKEPLIVIDTDRQAVYSLRFLTEIEWGLSLDAVAAIDKFFENDMNYMLYERG